MSRGGEGGGEREVWELAARRRCCERRVRVCFVLTRDRHGVHRGRLAVNLQHTNMTGLTKVGKEG